MKKILTIVTLAGMAAFTSCGPSKAEIEAKAKATADSLALLVAQAEAEAAKEKMIADSTASYAVAEEAKEKAEKAKAAKKSNKPKENAKPKETSKSKEEHGMPRHKSTRAVNVSKATNASTEQKKK